MRLPVVALSALFLSVVACDGTEPAVPTSIRVSPATVTLQTLGETQQMTAEVLDAAGAVIAEPFMFSWSSSSPSSVSVSSGGLVTAVGAGTATITASASSVSGSGTAVVDQTVAEVQISQGDGQVGEAGLQLSQDLVVVVFDAAGNPAAQKSVTFTVVDGGGSVTPNTATTNTAGRALTRWTLGSTPGANQRVRASIAGLQQDFTATAVEGLLRISTTTLNNARLTLSYQEALVGSGGDGSFTWSVTSGQLPAGLSLAANGQITGTPSAETTTTFTAQLADGSGGTATKSLSLRVCEGPLQVGFGQIIESQAGSANACGLFLPAGAPGDAYRLALVRLSESVSGSTVGVTVDLTVSGAVAVPAADALVAAFQPESPGNRIEFSAGMMEALRTEERTEALHHEIREAETRLISTLDRSALMRSASSRPDGGLTGVRAAFPSDPPATRSINVPGDFGSCSGGIPNASTLRGFNDYLAIYESDSNSPAVGQAEVDQLLNYYRDHGEQVVQAYFGGVTDIDGDGRINVLISPNVMTGTAAFVWSGDFFTTAQCADSNAGETVYFNPSVITAMAGGNYQALSTMVHEAKHVSSLYNRIASHSTPPFHPGFIEEGSAEIAGEMSSRVAWAAAGGPAVGAQVTGNAFQGGVTPDNYGIFLRLARMVFYMSSQPNGVTASLTSRQGGIYGSGLMFHRFLGDAYGGASTPMADAGLFRMQNDSLTTTGTAAYPSLVGKSYSDLLQEYAKAVMLHGTGFEAARTFTTYDLGTASEVFSLPDPAGAFPWPVTLTCGGTACPDDIDSRDPESLPDNDDRNVQTWTPFANSSFNSPMGPGGIRIFEFQSNGTGDGVEILVSGTTQTRVYLSRIR